MTSLGLILIFVLLLLLSFLSVLESAIAQLSRLALRVMAEKLGKNGILTEIARDRRRFLIPLQFGIQLTLVSLAVLVTLFFLEILGPPAGWVGALLAMAAVVLLFRQLVPVVLTVGKSEKVLRRLLPLLRATFVLLNALSLPIMILLRRLGDARGGDTEEQDDEATDEEIQAYLGVGEEEGIFERTEARLIQSALEFGNTLVREIMTPRNEIVGIEEGATVAELRDLIVTTKHSRIPVYRDRMDYIVGLVYVRNLLGLLQAHREEEPITSLINEIHIVPETKKVSKLLKEMQSKAEQMAVVINEYGTVSGLVTIEDLLEEIVGEISDEDEYRRLDLVYEGGGNYIVRGGVEVEELEEILGVDYGDFDAATVSGLVVEHLGSVPRPGDSIELDGTLIEILSADDRRIHTMRIRVVSDSEIAQK